MMFEQEREALMHLTMCAREECGMCKYEETCDFDFQYKLATENMHILADALRVKSFEPNDSEKPNNCEEDIYICDTCKWDCDKDVCGRCRDWNLYAPRKTNKAEKKQPTPILDYMVNGRIEVEPQTLDDKRRQIKAAYDDVVLDATAQKPWLKTDKDEPQERSE